MILLTGSKACAKAGTRQEMFEIASITVEIEETGGSYSSGKKCPSGKICAEYLCCRRTEAGLFQGEQRLRGQKAEQLVNDLSGIMGIGMGQVFRF